MYELHEVVNFVVGTTCESLGLGQSLDCWRPEAVEEIGKCGKISRFAAFLIKEGIDEYF